MLADHAAGAEGGGGTIHGESSARTAAGTQGPAGAAGPGVEVPDDKEENETKNDDETGLVQGAVGRGGWTP